MESKSDKGVALLGLILLTAAAAGCNTQKQNQVCFKENCFKVELAQTPDKISRGLMFRENLDHDAGMLFMFETEGTHPFWMKNTLIPLDIIWINETMEVAYISKNTQPCRADPCPGVNPGRRAKYVLEVNAGVSDEIGINAGDNVRFDLIGQY